MSQGYIAPISEQLIYISISLAAGAIAICGKCFYLSFLLAFYLSQFMEDLSGFE